MQDLLLEKRIEIAALCRKYHVRQMSVFGSAVRDDFDPLRSDVDLVVEFEEPFTADYVQNKLDLQETLVVLLGRQVDLIVEKYIRNPYLRRAVTEEGQLLYAA